MTNFRVDVSWSRHVLAGLINHRVILRILAVYRHIISVQCQILTSITKTYTFDSE